MKNVIKLGFLGMALALAAAALLPAATPIVAQEDGGIIIEGTFGAGPNQFNPLLCNDTACNRIVGLLFPGLTGTDPATATFKAGAPGSLAKEWSVSEDLKVVTYKLRDDAKWSDGTPITTKDIMYAWEMIQNDESGSPFTFVRGRVASVEAPDDYTLVVTLNEGSCDYLWDASIPGISPSHLFADVKPAELKDNAFSTTPSVGFGPFKFVEFRAGEQTSLAGNELYTDAAEGKVKPAGFIYKVVPDQTVMIEQFLAGETNLLDSPAVNRMADIKAAGDAGDVQVFSFPGVSWDYIGLNLADPTNPQNGVDENGKPIDQGKHPIFGDVQVRKALALGLDVDAMIKTAVFGEGTRMASNIIPTSWAVNPDLKPIPYNAEEAAKILDEAGWKVGADGIREKDGVRLSFNLMTNAGNTRREAIVTLAKDQLAQIGVEVNVELLDFNLVIERFYSQTYDAFVLGWRSGYPNRPDGTQLFDSSSDIVGSGSNMVSWYNEEWEKLNSDALTLAGCDMDARIKLYQKAQEVFQADLPYIPLFVINGMYAARSNVKGFSPYQAQLLWNVDTWEVLSVE